MVCGINVVVQTHPISSALSLIGVMGSLAVLYLLLGAEFMAAAQLIVYAGAIMVLFIFVIMLLNAGGEKQRAVRSPWNWWALRCWSYSSACWRISCSESSPVADGAFRRVQGRHRARNRPRAVH